MLGSLNVPIGLIGRVPNVLLVNPKSGINTVVELIARAKKTPGQLNYASNGNGTSLHLSAELFKTTTGTFITHITYRGAAQAVTGLMAGEVDMMFENLPSVLGQIQGGGVKALAARMAFGMTSTTPERGAERADSTLNCPPPTRARCAPSAGLFRVVATECACRGYPTSSSCSASLRPPSSRPMRAPRWLLRVARMPANRARSMPSPRARRWRGSARPPDALSC